ncbi:MAG: DUF4252 domain-containing protein [Bacteroidota bacterium]
MKKIITLLLIALFPVLAIAQNSAVDKIFKKYENRDGFTVVTISKGLLKMAADIDQEDQESTEFLSRINSIKILATEDESDVNLYDEVLSSLDKSDYEELMTVKSNDEDVLMLAKKDGDVIEELILLVGGKEDNALVYISGRMSMKDMAKISKSVNIEGAGLEHLKDVDK